MLKLTSYAICFIAFLAFSFSMWTRTWPSGQGIHPHKSGNAVYIEGEACTVNVVPAEEYRILTDWCLEQNRLHP